MNQQVNPVFRDTLNSWGKSNVRFPSTESVKCCLFVGKGTTQYCNEESVIAPKGWDAFCSDHFPADEFTKERIIEQYESTSPFYTDEELNYLAIMGIDVVGALSEIIRKELRERQERVVENNRREQTCSHCSCDMSKQRPHETCSNGGLCVSINEFDRRLLRQR